MLMAGTIPDKISITKKAVRMADLRVAFKSSFNEIGLSLRLLRDDPNIFVPSFRCSNFENENENVRQFAKLQQRAFPNSQYPYEFRLGENYSEVGKNPAKQELYRQRIYQQKLVDLSLIHI